jgi:hypothetical protein
MDRRIGHLRRYTATSLTNAVERAGLLMQRRGYADCLGVAATLLYKLAGDRGGAINERALVAYDRFVFPLSRALDIAFGSFVGKNAWLLATRPQRRLSNQP